jgi:hypothetical protein
MKVGVIITSPLRIAYLNGDYGRAFDLLKDAGIKIAYRTVASVEPYHATIHVEPEDKEKARAIIEQAGIRLYPPIPFY